MGVVIFIESTHTALDALFVAQKRGYKVFFITSNNFSYLYSRQSIEKIESCATIVIAENTQSSASLIDVISTIKCKESIDALITTFQLVVEPVAIAASSLDLLFTSELAIINSRNKIKTREILKNNGIASVKFQKVENLEGAYQASQHIGLPAIIKPMTGVAKMLTSIVHDLDDITRHFENENKLFLELDSTKQNEVMGGYIYEELIVGDLYSIDFAVSKLLNYFPLTISKRKAAIDNNSFELGSTLPSGLHEEQELDVYHYTKSICQALGLDLGIFQIEFIFSENGPILVEVNPRIAGGQIPSLIQTATGYNIYELLLDIHLGKNVAIDWLPIQRAASHTFICAKEDCLISDDLPDTWDSEIKSMASQSNMPFTAGQKLSQCKGNWDILGYFQVIGGTIMDTYTKSNSIIKEVEKKLGVNLVRF